MIFNSNQKSTENYKEQNVHYNYIKLRTSNNGTVLISTEEIIRCQASSNYTWFYFKDKTPLLIAKTLGIYAHFLEENDFIRIHQSHVINRAYINRMDANGEIWLTDGTKYVVSKRRKKMVKKQMCGCKLGNGFLVKKTAANL
ncbi:MAG: LytTR family transcriptional regulator [Ferruginibacter sp.]|nr:LytTR family transcriptional regulator [Ferruginibacter sp.]